MTDIVNDRVPEQGKLRRALAAAWAFLQAMEYSSTDYTFDRLDRLEREVERLRKELHQGREAGRVDAHNNSAAGLER